MKNYHIPTWKGTIILLLVAEIFTGFALFSSQKAQSETAVDYSMEATPTTKTVGDYSRAALPIAKIESVMTNISNFLSSSAKQKESLSVPAPPIMEKMKTAGCVADGALNGWGGDEKGLIKLINDSNCYYLHRAVETWLEPPDFDDVRENILKLKNRENMVLGMFIAEAIDTKAKYRYPGKNRNFDFSKMCRQGSKNFWGEHTCKPSLAEEEYRDYVRYITEEAMDLGVQSFMFGQVFYQDSVENSRMAEMMAEMKEFASFRGIEIVIGAQTNDIVDEEYLRQFDFIEGGVGLAQDGTVESGACFSRWDNWCWALLWHEKYKSKANNVFVHFDWSGKKGDDMSTFALMNEKTRHKTLANLHSYFINQDVGFLLPIQAVLHKENGGCHGSSRKFYTPDDEYSCKDEAVIKEILKDQK